ncbi:mCG142639 [Mus musculus]|nr:mCG142639 [Mus musculus]|eukprot:NP_001095076.1 uncharacterized protein LOC667794 [Mus musculus]
MGLGNGITKGCRRLTDMTTSLSVYLKADRNISWLLSRSPPSACDPPWLSVPPKPLVINHQDLTFQETPLYSCCFHTQLFPDSRERRLRRKTHGIRDILGH